MDFFESGASSISIARTEIADNFTDIEREVKQKNPNDPILAILSRS
jgi:hypothetical protein